MTMGRITDIHGEDGIGLVDVLVSMVIAMMVTGLVVTMAIAGFRATRYTEQDSDALAAERVALDRLEKELRQARFIYATSSNATTLKFWIDTDLDHAEDADEKITWQVSNVSGTIAQLTRDTDGIGVNPTIVTRDLLWTTGFTYFVYDADKSLVTISFIADLNTTSLAPTRTVSTDINLRNLQI